MSRDMLQLQPHPLLLQPSAGTPPPHTNHTPPQSSSKLLALSLGIGFGDAERKGGQCKACIRCLKPPPAPAPAPCPSHVVLLSPPLPLWGVG